MKSYKKFIIGSIIVVLGFILIYFGKGLYNSNKMITNTDKNSNNIEVSSNDNSNSKNKVEYVNKSRSMKENYPQKSQKLEFSDKKNFFTIPGQENIKQDDFGEYVDGEILVDVDLDKFDEKTFEKYGAKIVGKCDTWGGYQINIANKSVKELEKIAEKIKKEDGVLISEVHRLMPVKNNDYSYPDDKFELRVNKKTREYDKNNLWENYDIEKGLKIDKNAKAEILYEDPYWSYKITNLAYMWKNLDYKDQTQVGVFENGKILNFLNLNKTIREDLNYENLNPNNLKDDASKESVKKLYKEAEDKKKLHTYLVSSTLAAKHNDIGFSGVGKDVKIYPTVFDSSVLPYLISYRIDQTNNKIKIFNISWGLIPESLYYVNASNKDIKKDFKNEKLSEILKYNEDVNSKNVEEYADKIKKDFENSSARLDLGLKGLKNHGKDFLIVKSAGNEGEEIRKIEKYSNVRIKNKSAFNGIDDDLKNNVIIVGAAAPYLKHNKKLDFANFSNTENVDIAAPGVNVPGYNRRAEVMLWDGTSASAPFVSGLAANLYSAYPDKMNGELAKELIVKSGNIDVIDEFNGENSKLVDAKKLTELAKKKFEDKKETTKKDTKKDNNEKIIKENKKDDKKIKDGNLKKIENQKSTVSSNENQKKPPVENDDKNTASKNSCKIIQDGKDEGEISIFDMGDVHFIDVGKLNEIYLKDSTYFTDPQYSDIKNKFEKLLEENNGKYIKENSDGSYYFGFFPGNIDVPENMPNYSYQYFPEYGVFTFARKDYMKEESVYFLNNKFAGIISDDKLYVEADWLAWWFDFELDYSIDSKNKVIKYNTEGHDIGQEGVDYIKISTQNYNSLEELLEDNFEKIN
ncbi:S8 family peptidase [Anaerococcus jeddahensis]|uniref:S8 family peptidase n=1 Tax=Anaerococcus jeddahensis TaxID=1673719 RepID=UPI0006725A1C|nr:S8 family serine peptidase [Anaerococcus jeddahensis]